MATCTGACIAERTGTTVVPAKHDRTTNSLPDVYSARSAHPMDATSGQLYASNTSALALRANRYRRGADGAIHRAILEGVNPFAASTLVALHARVPSISCPVQVCL